MRKLFLLWLLSNVFNFVVGQQHSFLQFSLPEGLPQSQVRTLMQDSKGYIWVGTLGGASKFNGKNFVNYDRSSGLINNQINTIIEDAKGQIIIGSIGGISIHRFNRFKNYKLLGNLKNVSVTCLLEFTPNEIWVGTEKGLVLFSNDTLTQNNEALFFGEEYIRSISKNETGELCVLTKTKLFKQNKQTRQWEKILELVNPDESFQDFWSRPAGYWYTTTAGGIRTSDSLNCPIPTILKPYFETAEIMFTQIDVFAEKVFFSSRSGVLYFNQQTIETNFFSTTNGLDNSDARCVLVDREGNPWIATYGGGLYKYLGNAIRTYNQFDGLAGNAVMTMFKQNNNLFFGTFENGITANYTTLNNPLASKLISGLKNETRIWTSAIDAQGRPWVGTLNGVYFFEENCNSCPKWVNINSENNGLNENLVLSLLPVKAGMYVGTNKGIQLINENSITSFNHLANYPGTRIRHMIETKNGHIWMATREGITRFDGKSFQSFGESTGWVDASSFSIAELPNGLIVAGTQNGIYIGNENGFEHKNIDLSPGSNTVNFLKIIRNYLWIGTLNGIFLWEIDGNGNLSETKHHLNLSDGLISLETNLNAIYQDLNIAWVGTPLGVMSIDIDDIEIKFSSPIPIVHITNIQANLRDINWLEKNSEWDGLGFPQNVEFSHGDNSFTFYFDAASTTYPERLEFSYWLEGLDETWSSPTSFSQVNFNNLPSGKYHFHVRSRTGPNGNWSSEEVWNFVILPPWWLSWWGIALESFAVILSITLIVRTRQKNLKNKHWAEQADLRAKLMVLEQQSMNSSMNRHFVFNALNSIQYYINRQDRKAANQYLTDFAKLIRKNLDSGEENYTPLSEEIERLELYLRLEQMRFPDTFQYEICLENQSKLGKLKVPSMLLQPFLENSIWHGLIPKGQEGWLKLQVFESKGCLQICIQDNGIGIEASRLKKPYTETHISKGMEITRNRLALIEQMTGMRIELTGPEDILPENGERVTQVLLIFPKDFQEIFS